MNTLCPYPTRLRLHRTSVCRCSGGRSGAGADGVVERPAGRKAPCRAGQGKSASASGIEYSLIRSRRKTADIVIERDGQIVVRAPEAVPADEIADIVDAKQSWIYRSLAEWRDLNTTRVLREFRDGEGFLYLGRAYRLRLVSGQEQPLSLRDGRFLLRRELAESGDPQAARTAFRKYYVKIGRERIAKRVAYLAPKAGG